jgi:uncharacterized protein with HEPN domain
MSPHDRIRLQHMADAIDAALRFVKDRPRSDLDTDEMLLFALVRAVEVVGEAAAKGPPEGRGTANLPWAAVVGMRNRLVHAYFDINRDILWTTVTESLPQLRRIVGTAPTSVGRGH